MNWLYLKTLELIVLLITNKQNRIVHNCLILMRKTLQQASFAISIANLKSN